VVTCLCALTWSSESEAMRFGAFEINPSLSLEELFTDNVFETNTDRRSDFSTVITPALQIIFPRTKKKYTVELYYQAALERFNRFTSENADNHKAIGKFDEKFPGGLELFVSDEFNRTHDLRGTNLTPELAFYKSNLVTSSAAYELSERVKMRVDYTNFILNYEDDSNKFRNRTDNGVMGYVYYRCLPKTSAFIEYDFVMIDYVKSDELDSREHHFYGGVTWDITGKTKGTVKAGYGIKDFLNTGIGGYKGAIVELVIDHNFNTRNSLKIRGTRSTEETNIEGNNFFVTTGLSLEYFHKFTGKITGKAFASYERDSYRGDQPIKDDLWEGGLGIIYQIRKWLRTEAQYSYTKRNSDSEDFRYSNNVYSLKIVATP